MSAPQPPSGELTSWKEIADFLGIGVRTAQSWERNRGLPVRRFPGEKSRVSAIPAELERWKRTAAGLPGWWNSVRFFRAYAIAITLVAAASLALNVAMSLAQKRRGKPALFRVEYRTLMVLDSAGREVWRRSFDEPLLPSGYNGDEGQQRVWFGDLDGDSRLEILFVHFSSSYETKGTPLICFTEQGEERWRFAPGVISDASTTYPAHYVASGFEVVDLGDGRGRGIAITSRHTLHHPNHFTVLDPGGRMRGQYWHSGHLDYMAFADLDADGVKEILLAGVNNGRTAATLVVLDPRGFTGVSDQGPGSRLQLQGFPLAREKAVLMFPRTCVSRKLEPYNMARFVRLAEGLIRVNVYETPDDALALYWLKPDLEVARVEVSDRFASLHRKLESEGALDHPLTPQEVERLRAVTYLKRPAR